MILIEKIKQIFEKEAIDEEIQPEEIERRVLKILAVHREKLQELRKEVARILRASGCTIGLKDEVDSEFKKVFGEMEKEETQTK